MISPRFFAGASSYSTLTARMLAPVGPSILPRSTIAALPASSARVTSWVFFLGGITQRLLSVCCTGLSQELASIINARQPRDFTTALVHGSKRRAQSQVPPTSVTGPVGGRLPGG